MARYVLKTAHFLDNVWYPAGAEIEWAGPKSAQMVPSDQWAMRRNRQRAGAGSINRGRVVSNPNANPPAVSGNIFPAKPTMAGPEAPAVPVAGPQDERNPEFVPPSGGRPLHPGVAEDASDAHATAQLEREQHRAAAEQPAPPARGKTK
jgi:hypothetical protein